MNGFEHKYIGKAVPPLAFPRREGGYVKGHETREEILHAALHILVEEGYRAMSMRRIAATCGMRLGNLTYHFPSREDLVQALLEAVITSYELEFADISHDPAYTPEQRVALYCELVLEDIRSKKTTRVFPELWALSNHDDFVFERIHELYRRARALLVEAVKEMRPDLPETERQALALFISASMEGLTVFAGYQKPYEPQMPLIEDIALRSFIGIIRGYPRATPEAAALM